MDESVQAGQDAPSSAPRRSFLAGAAGAAMAGGLIGGYGTFAYLLGRFVYPAESHDRGWLFVCTVDDLPRGRALNFVTPAGAKIVVTRQGEGAAAEDFLALSSVCPHLGCQVHWEPHHDRFFCPCHNGAFDKSGAATAGPPLAAKQSLLRYPLQVDEGLLFLEAPLAALVAQRAPAPGGPAPSSHQGTA